MSSRPPSPTYTSSSEEVVNNKQKEKVRGGVRKVVGDTAVEQEQALPRFDIDFGRTVRLTPDSSRAGSRAPSRNGLSTGRISPFDSLGKPDTPQSPYVEPARVVDRSIKESNQLNRGRSKSPFSVNTALNQSPRLADRDHHTSQAPVRPMHSRGSSYAWRPNTADALFNHAGQMSAEEFVQQRAMQAMQPQPYVSTRTLSAGRLDIMKQEYLAAQRQESAQPSARPVNPSSPVASPAIPRPRPLHRHTTSVNRHSASSSTDFSAHLSAREREYVARMTGGTLLDMRNVNEKDKRIPDPNVGLIGAIQARTQEKEDIRQGLKGQMVSAAIEQRQREIQILARRQAEQQQEMERKMAELDMIQAQQNLQAYSAQLHHGMLTPQGNMMPQYMGVSSPVWQTQPIVYTPGSTMVNNHVHLPTQQPQPVQMLLESQYAPSMTFQPRVVSNPLPQTPGSYMSSGQAYGERSGASMTRPISTHLRQNSNLSGYFGRR